MNTLLISLFVVSSFIQKEKYPVLNKNQQDDDLVIHAECWIVRNQTGDSIALDAMSYRDWPAPKFFF